MKKVLILILFVFCLCSLLGGVFLVPNAVHADETSSGSTYYICAATKQSEKVEGGFSIGLKEYVELFYNVSDSINHQKDTIVLQNNIDLSDVRLDGVKQDSVVLQNTIGNAEKPFMGTFDGNGFSILNLKIDLSAQENLVQNVGLFGCAKNANFVNVGLGQSVNLKVGNCLTAYVGALVGKAENCKFKQIQLDVNAFSVAGSFDFNMDFGGLVGMAQDCEMTYVVGRSTFQNLNLQETGSRVHAFGGIVGRQNNSSILFAVVENNFSVTIGNGFDGVTYLGGVAGAVSEGGSKIINAAIENKFTVTNFASLVYGEVAGAILNPEPISTDSAKHLSYIHFKRNSDVNAFGNAGSYALSGAYISESGKALSESDQYFASESWHPFYGAWDFDTIWYVKTSNLKIELQCFIESFSVGVSNANTSILSGKLNGTNFRYGNQARIAFQFADKMAEFYSVSTLNLGNLEVARIYSREEDDKIVYSLSNSDLYDIQATENGFDIVIKSINLATDGTYSVTTTARNFDVKISSKLIGEDGQLVQDVVPGYVFYIVDNTEVSLSNELSLNRIRFDQSFRIGTRAKPGTPYAFEGWFMEGRGEPVSTSPILAFTFGHDIYVSDFKIYAKYSMNACNITCKMDEGIVKIVFSDTIEVDQSEQVVVVSKGGQLKIKIFVENGYSFDADSFVAELDIFKSLNPDVKELEEEGLKCFQFIFDLDGINDDFLDSFTINARTVRENDGNNSWLWWVIGGVAGAVVLVGIIILIVVLAKRRGGGIGGMGGTGKVNKKAYKNMYY